jgi:hypothetical protein
MDLQHKIVYLLHDEDSYEIVVNGDHRILEIWRYAANKPSVPQFCVFEHLNEVLQDRIYDKIVKQI